MEQFVNPSVKEIKAMIANGQKPMMFYHIPKQEIVNKNFHGLDKILNIAKAVGKGAKRSIILTVDGYDDTTDELFEIKEVRDYVEAMFKKYPYILYYISDFHEADVWILNSYADELTSVSMGEKYTSNQLFEMYGIDDTNVPQIYSNLTFKSDKFLNMLKAIIKHGKLNKDARGGKRVAIEYAFRFDNVEDSLKRLGIYI